MSKSQSTTSLKVVHNSEAPRLRDSEDMKTPTVPIDVEKLFREVEHLKRASQIRAAVNNQVVKAVPVSDLPLPVKDLSEAPYKRTPTQRGFPKTDPPSSALSTTPQAPINPPRQRTIAEAFNDLPHPIKSSILQLETCKENMQDFNETFALVMSEHAAFEVLLHVLLEGRMISLPVTATGTPDYSVNIPKESRKIWMIKSCLLQGRYPEIEVINTETQNGKIEPESFLVPLRALFHYNELYQLPSRSNR